MANSLGLNGSITMSVRSNKIYYPVYPSKETKIYCKE